MKIGRLLSILTILLQRDHVTAPELARRLEVSRRTISRDIDDLCKAGFPIATMQGSGGGISISRGYKLDKSILTRDELQSILIGLRGLESVDGASRIGRLMDKLAPSPDAAVPLGNGIAIDLASHYKDSLSDKIALLRDAVGENRIVSFDYYSPSGVARRAAEPYLVFFKWSAWYLFGFCLDKLDFRTFKLNRLWRIEETGRDFIPRQVPPERMDFDARLPDHIPLVVLFDPAVEYLVVEAYGPDACTREPDGRLRFERGYTYKEHILRWILGFGDKAEVLAPESLRREIAGILRHMGSLYD